MGPSIVKYKFLKQRKLVVVKPLSEEKLENSNESESLDYCKMVEGNVKKRTTLLSAMWCETDSRLQL